MAVQSGPQSSNEKASIKLSAQNRLISEKDSKKIKKNLLEQLNKEKITINSVVCLSVGKDPKKFNVLITRNPATGIEEFHTYDPGFELGEGGQGKVVLAQNIMTGDLVALKIQYPKGMTFEADVQLERQNLEKAKQLIGIAEDKEGTQYTLMKYCDGNNLLHDLYEIDKSKGKEEVDYFKTKKDLPTIQKFHLIYLALNEVIKLHKEHHLSHRDLKTENFVSLIRPFVTLISLIDLGSAVDPDAQDAYTKSLLTDFTGTFGYIAPEVHKREPYSYATDYWALAVVCAEILTKENYQAKLKAVNAENKKHDRLRHPSAEDIKAMMADVFVVDLQGKTLKDALFDSATHLSALSENASINLELERLAKIFIVWLMQEDPTKRPTLAELERIKSTFNSCFTKACLVLNNQSRQEQPRKMSRRLSVYPNIATNFQPLVTLPTIDSPTTTSTVDSPATDDPIMSESTQEECMIKELRRLMDVLSVNPSTPSFAVNENDKITLSLLKQYVSTTLETSGTPDFDVKLKVMSKMAEKYMVHPKSSIQGPISDFKETCSKLKPIVLKK